MNPPFGLFSPMPNAAWPSDIPLPAHHDFAMRSTPNTLAAQFKNDLAGVAVFEHFLKTLPPEGWRLDYQSSDTLETRHRKLYTAHLDATKHRRTVSINIMDAGDDEMRTTMSHIDYAIASETRPAPQASEILNALYAAYAGAATYRDRGSERTTLMYAPEGGKRVNTRGFATNFVRPDRFRFEFVDERHRYVIHQEGEKVQSHWTIGDRREQHATLGDALGAAAGVSGGTSWTVAGLLGLTDKPPIQHLNGFHLLENESLAGVDCRIVEGRDRHCLPARLYIDTLNSSLRRIQTMHVFAKFTTESVTDYDPEINGVVPDELLEFNQGGQLPLLNGGEDN